MKALFPVLLIVYSFSVDAQKIRFTDSTNQWTTLSINGDGCSFANYFSYYRDTVIHGIAYKSLHGDGSQFFGYHNSCYCGTSDPAFQFNYFIREDTVAGMVYYVNFSSVAPDTLEHVLYNYNLTVGDTISYGSNADTVASIDSTLVNGVYHKIFNMQGLIGSARTYTVLEGIGCTNDPIFQSWFGGCFEYGESLVCFNNKGVLPAIHIPVNSCSAYGSPCMSLVSGVFDNMANCNALSVKNTEIKKPFFTTEPNPAFNNINITTSSEFDNNTTILVYDISGRCISKTKADEHESTATINISSWNDGLYMVIIQNNTGVVDKDKIVVMK